MLALLVDRSSWWQLSITPAVSGTTVIPALLGHRVVLSSLNWTVVGIANTGRRLNITGNTARPFAFRASPANAVMRWKFDLPFLSDPDTAVGIVYTIALADVATSLIATGCYIPN
jgi:hypothetical protein